MSATPREPAATPGPGDADFYRRQQEALGEVVGGCNVVITTAAVPGRKAPVLIPRQAVEAMAPHSVIVDLGGRNGGATASRRGRVKPSTTAGVRILGPTNLPATVPYHASQMYSHNLAAFLTHLLDDEGRLHLDPADEITAATPGHQRRPCRQRPRPRSDGSDPRRPTRSNGAGGARRRERRRIKEEMESLVAAVTVFVLAVFVGFEIITKIPPTLHTPLMSGSNAISGITLIGALLSAGSQRTELAAWLGLAAVGPGDGQRRRRVPGHPPHARHVQAPLLTACRSTP